MNYYLTRMEYFYNPLSINEKLTLTQLVKASSKENARIAVQIAAAEDKGDEITIIEIKVLDTLIGI